MTFRRKLAATLAGTAALVAGATVSTMPANAGTTGIGNGVCESGEVCLYRAGTLIHDLWPSSPSGCSGQTRTAYDYLRNRSAWPQRAWSGTNCTGRFNDFPSGTEGPVNLFWSLGYAG
ncbi:hypothetical protein OG394_26620 [Kribbella sp. NBC_01245]|uniref:hypothetical protein n=1 Tax=Kribbella sp. NBC_01245 TaxID=2903578 RepID=UPI002E27C405|nr:hypothetical protein [Kribbella sp. NBC_01245]